MLPPQGGIPPLAEVSILTQPGGRVLLFLSVFLALNKPVSILTQPGGRVLRSTRTEHPPQCGFNPHPARRPGATLVEEINTLRAKFQSSPSPEAGCYKISLASAAFSSQFQSSPSPEAGCYHVYLTTQQPDNVSILTQPGGRVLRCRCSSSGRK